MSASTSAGQRRVEKEAMQRSRDCLDQLVTHVRVGSWRGTEDCEVTLIGHVRDLHGTVCTCCPRRTSSTGSGGGVVMLGGQDREPRRPSEVEVLLGKLQESVDRARADRKAARTVRCDRTAPHRAHTYVATAKSGIDLHCPGVPA